MSIDREQQFRDLHLRIWGDFEMAGFPLPYRELIDTLQTQATMMVLTTVEDIEIMRIEVTLREGKFYPDAQVHDFCKTLHSLSGEEGRPGSTTNTIFKVASKLVHEFTDEDWRNLKTIKESLAKSQMKRDNVTGPFKTAWKED